jgi:hypothetical protein
MAGDLDFDMLRHPSQQQKIPRMAAENALHEYGGNAVHF